ncbi:MULTISPECIES: hypothetical protein [unclassified Carboxylicivirga]|uniref:hypothetical protein n=1 Tax=Carboxylicivirga TaxID=1628153 RepID=UPI003D326485
MSNTQPNKKYTIGGIRFNTNILCPLFELDTKASSYPFAVSNSTEAGDWNMSIDAASVIERQHHTNCFSGVEEFDNELPYKWSVVKQGSHEGILVEFEQDEGIREALAIINTAERQVTIQLCLHKQQALLIDPFMHPIGILILQYIVHYYGGFVIHASTVSYHGKGYLFTAVSGTGKSTMAGLWQAYGATIINDDRLIVLPEGNGFCAYNTPMPYYQDVSKKVPLHKAFLIDQSPTNFLDKQTVLKGTLGLLGNCMQFQYNEAQVQQRLNTLHKLTEQIGVYRCGFKPDEEIVKLILRELG